MSFSFNEICWLIIQDNSIGKSDCELIFVKTFWLPLKLISSTDKNDLFYKIHSHIGSSPYATEKFDITKVMERNKLT